MDEPRSRPGISRLAPSLVLLLLVVPMAIPLLRPGWIQSHEGLSYPIRLVEIMRCWEGGLYSARWFPDLNNGQGYPFLNFYAPLFFMISGSLHALGLGAGLSMKLPVLLGTWLGAAGAYRLAREATGVPGALVAGALYAYAPYVVRDVFIRGDLAEYLALGFLPWSLFAVLRLRNARGARDVLLVSGCGALPILTHNITGLVTGGMMLIAALIAMGASRERIATGRAALAGGVGALVLTAFFWVPALYEKRFVQIEAMIEGQYDVHDHYVSLLDLLGPGEVPGVGQDLPMTFEIGYAPLALLLLAVPVVRRFSPDVRAPLTLALACFGIGLVMATVIGSPIYHAAPLLRFVQFPWRFLGLLALGAALLGGIGLGTRLEKFAPRVRFAGAAVAIAAAVALASPLLGPKVNVDPPEWAVDPEHLASTRQTTSGVGEYLPIWMEEKKTPRGFENGVKLLGEGTVEGEGRGVGRYAFTVDAPDSVTVILRDVYFPGWTATANGGPIEVNPRAKTGRIELRAAPGRSEIRVRLEPTPLRRACRWVSGIAALAAVLVLAASALPKSRRGAS